MNGLILREAYSGLVVTKATFSNATYIQWAAHTEAGPILVMNGEKSTMINTSILSKITTPKEEILFITSDANQQRDYTYSPGFGKWSVDHNMQNEFFFYDDVYYGPTEHRFPKKLDKIQVNDKTGRTRREVELNYTSNVNTRLKLTSLKIKGSGDIYEGYQEYKFDYNAIELPPYLSRKVDHYGFYNGRDTYSSQNSNLFYTMDRNLYNTSRDADSNYVRAEVLEKLTYPTGGYTSFEYESNAYGSSFQTWPFQVNTNQNNATLLTGGLRIKGITNYTEGNQIAGFKKYHYVKNYNTNGTVSSGVKSYQPTYFESYTGEMTRPASSPASSSSFYSKTFTYFKFSTNPIYPMGQTRGNHVTYSEVAEENADGSSIIYKYKNYDNGYGDTKPLAYISDNTGLKNFWEEDEGTSLGIERGQLLSEQYFDDLKNIKRKVEYKYNNDTLRFQDFVRVINRSYNSPNDYKVPSIRYSAFPIYTYYPYLREKMEYDYNSNSNSATKTTFAYDPSYRNLKEVVTEASDGSNVKTINRYATDVPDSLGQYNLMLQKFMISKVIENEQQVDGIKLVKSISQFNIGLSSDLQLVLPSSNKIQYQDGPEINKLTYNKYDKIGNVLSVSSEKGINTCYVWAYGKLYPIAKIENATYDDVKAVLGGESVIDLFGDRSFPTDLEVNAFLAPLRTDLRLKDAYVSSLTYDPINGVTSKTDVKGLTEYYGYDGFQRLRQVMDHDHNIIKYFCYNYAGQVVDCNLAVPAVTVPYYLSYTTTKEKVCSTPLKDLQFVNVFTNDFGKTYYSDNALTAPVRDGFYVTHVIGKTSYYSQVVNGITVNSSTCSR